MNDLFVAPDARGRGFVICVALLALAAAGVWRISFNDRPSLGLLRAVSGPDDITLPLDAYRLNRDQADRVETARRLIIAQCAFRFGVTLTDDSNLETGMENDENRRYGIVGLEQARANGYHLPAARSSDSFAESKWSPTPREYEVVTGARLSGATIESNAVPQDQRGQPLPADGCAGEAGRHLGSGGSSSSHEVDSLDRQTYKLAEADPRVQSAWTAWSECMAETGYAFGTPWDANDAFTSASATSVEKQTAIADVTCRTRTQLTSIWLTVETAYQTEVIKRHRSALAEVRSNNSRAVSVADQVITDQ